MTTASASLEAHRDSVRAIAHNFGVSDREISLAPRQGQVNLTVFLGNDLVLRLPRKQRFEDRLSKEAELIPFVLDRGIPTARLVSFDPGHTVADITYIVLERLHGQMINDIPSPADGGSRLYGSLFEILSSLHSIRRDSEPQIRSVETAEFAYEVLDELTSSGEIGGSQAAWLRRWFDHLESQGARDSEPVLLHGDVMPSNLIMNESGDVTAIIDWGSACWGEAARDLASFRTSTLPVVVDTYRAATASHQAAAGGVGALEASVLWYQLIFALLKLLGRQSTSETRNWSAPREARLIEIVRFLTTNVPDRWKSLLPED
ncbi:phosphotransferase family protein [Microlunatus endophyticus]|uniref:phosphotransferase family protein n=1 Tax=Microlunatus endophyticus TaxID=1716077 RepID=UPI00166C80E8|nr:aminoglycoside phosphotransferase family protein [Microlunatus endophyticus]